MKIHMLHTRKGCPDGFVTKVYLKGEDYTVPDSLGHYFLRQGVACNMDHYEDAPEANTILGDLFENFRKEFRPRDLPRPIQNPATLIAKGEDL